MKITIIIIIIITIVIIIDHLTTVATSNLGLKLLYLMAFFALFDIFSRCYNHMEIFSTSVFMMQQGLIIFNLLIFMILL